MGVHRVEGVGWRDVDLLNWMYNRENYFELLAWE